MLFLIFIASIFSFKNSIIESTPSRGILQIKSNINKPSIIVLKFPEMTFPYLRKHKNIIFMKKTKKNSLYVVLRNKKKFKFTIEYDKLIFKIRDYKWNAERGFYFPKSYLITKNKVYENNRIFDTYYVPDFTVPFLAFNTCGCIFAVIFGLIVKNNIRKKM